MPLYAGWLPSDKCPDKRHPTLTDLVLFQQHLDSTSPDLTFFQNRRIQQREMGFRVHEGTPFVLGRDDSRLSDGQTVFVVKVGSPMQTIDYFHGDYYGIPMAQMVGRKKTNYPSFMLVSQKGCFAMAVIFIQGLFRSKRNCRMLIDCRLLPLCLRVSEIQSCVASYVGRSYCKIDEDHDGARFKTDIILRRKSHAR